MTVRIVENHVELDETEARAGQTGVHVRYILLSSLALALAAFALVAIFA